MKEFKYFLLGIIAIILVVGISFTMASLLIYGVCWAFGLSFTFKYAIGGYLLIVLLGFIFNRG